MANNKNFKVKNGFQAPVIHESLGTVTSESVGYSLAGAVWDGVSFSVSAQETVPSGLFFKPDGTKMYVLGSTGDDVNEYNLSTAWDVSTASYLQNFSVSAQSSAPFGLFFKPDGTKMYTNGAVADEILEYNLSTAWDVSTASYLQSFSVSAQDAASTGFFFKSDGTKMYVLGATGDDVNEYDLSTAWDVSTASYLQNFYVGNEETAPYALFFKSDGTTMFVVGDANNSVYEYVLSTAWDISTASYTTTSYSVSDQEGTPQGLFFKSDGTKMYVVGSGNDTVYQYSTVLTTNTLDLSTGSVFELTPTSSSIEISLSNPPASGVAGGATLIINQDGVGSNDIRDPKYLSLLDIDSEVPLPIGMDLKTDGTKLYIFDNTDNVVHQYSLTTAWDITTATFDSKTFNTSTQITTPASLSFKSDGTAMFVLCGTTDTVYQYTLSTAWDVSTASYASKSFSVTTQENQPYAMAFKPDGTKMYIGGLTADAYFQYTLSTAWDVSTASYDSVTYAPSQSNMYSMALSSDGTYIYNMNSSEVLYQHKLSTPYDLSTATYTGQTYSFNSFLGTDAYAIKVVDNDTKLILSAYNNSRGSIFSFAIKTTPTIVYDDSIQWADGSAPDATQITETSVQVFTTSDGGVTYQGLPAIQRAK